MAIIQSSTFTGVPANEARPGARAQVGTHLKNIAKDQARAYEQVTGLKVPNSSTISATPHVHDGTSGVIIPIPLSQQTICASLRSRDTAAYTDEYAPFSCPCFFVPAGVTSVRVLLHVDEHTYASRLRDLFQFRTYDASLTQTDQVGVHGYDNPYDGCYILWADVDVTAGEVNVLWLMSWDGYYYPGSTERLNEQRNRTIWGWTVLPSAGAYTSASEPYQFAERDVASGEVVTPGDTQHIGAHAYTTMNDHMMTDDYGVSSYLLHGLSLNDALLFEKITGRAAGGQALAHTNDENHAGHVHDGDTGYLNTDKGGAVMDQPLGSWSWGVLRNRDATTPPTGFLSHDASGGLDDRWGGRIHAARQHSLAHATTNYEFAELRFRLPEVANAADVQAGGKLKFFAYVRNDSGKSAGRIEAQLHSPSRVQSGTASVMTCSAGALALEALTATLDLYGTGNSSGLEVLLTLKMGIPSLAAGTSIGILSACIYLEA